MVAASTARARLAVVLMSAAAAGFLAGTDAQAQLMQGAPERIHIVQELTPTFDLIQQSSGSSSTTGPLVTKIELGRKGQSSPLSPFVYAEATSDFANNTLTDSTIVVAAPGGGIGYSIISWNFSFLKTEPGGQFIFDITGARVQLQDLYGIENIPVQGAFGLRGYAYGTEGEFLRFDNRAELKGSGGIPAASTFAFESTGFAAPPVFDEQRLSYFDSNGVAQTTVIGATLELPPQLLLLDLSTIFVGTQFTFYAEMYATAYAPLLDGHGALAFISDPTSFDGGLPAASGNALSFTGVELLAPVPEPGQGLLLLVGLAALAGVTRRRRGSAA